MGFLNGAIGNNQTLDTIIKQMTGDQFDGFAGTD